MCLGLLYRIAIKFTQHWCGKDSAGDPSRSWSSGLSTTHGFRACNCTTYQWGPISLCMTIVLSPSVVYDHRSLWRIEDSLTVMLRSPHPHPITLYPSSDFDFNSLWYVSQCSPVHFQERSLLKKLTYCFINNECVRALPWSQWPWKYQCGGVNLNKS